MAFEQESKEAIIVVRDKGGKGMSQCTSSRVPEDDDGEHV